MTDEKPPTWPPSRLLPLKDFLEIGYVQELNRRFLHPLGLALAYVTDPKDESAYLMVFDCRHEPDGIIFSDVTDPDTIAKAERIEKLFEQRRLAREASLGFLIQPVGAPSDAAANRE